MTTIFVYLNVTQLEAIIALTAQQTSEKNSSSIKQEEVQVSRKSHLSDGLQTSDTSSPICLIATHCPFRRLIILLQSSPVSRDIRGGGGCRGGRGGACFHFLPGPLVVLPNKKQAAIVVQHRGYPQSHTLCLFMEPPVNCGLSQLCPFSGQ